MKAKCRQCTYLNYSCIIGVYEFDSPYFCGLHGRARIDPDGDQPNLDMHGSCGFSPKFFEEQLNLFEVYDD